MHTIKLQVEDSEYQDLVQKGIDIQSKFKEFLLDFADDGYAKITTEEAKKRISEAVEEYRNGIMKTVSHNDVWEEINTHTKNKIADRL